jgi:hypothetical protein
MKMSKYEYRVVRSYTDGCLAKATALEKAFAEGFEFVRASEVVANYSGKSGYIEYIVRKEVNNE